MKAEGHELSGWKDKQRLGSRPPGKALLGGRWWEGIQPGQKEQGGRVTEGSGLKAKKQLEDGRDFTAKGFFGWFTKASFSGFLYQFKGKSCLHTILACPDIDFPIA